MDSHGFWKSGHANQENQAGQAKTAHFFLSSASVWPIRNTTPEISTINKFKPNSQPTYSQTLITRPIFWWFLEPIYGKMKLGWFTIVVAIIIPKPDDRFRIDGQHRFCQAACLPFGLPLLLEIRVQSPGTAVEVPGESLESDMSQVHIFDGHPNHI